MKTEYTLIAPARRRATQQAGFARALGRGIAGALVLAAVLATASCQKARAADEPLVGIAKIVSHPALDELEKGIVEEVSAAFPKARFDRQNANGEPATATQIAQKFKMSKASIAVGIATPTAMALANTISEFPVVYSAVTDPVAAGLVPSFEQGGANVTGTSDLPPVENQIDTLLAIAPGITRVGHVYSAGEANSVTTAARLKAYCTRKGLSFVPSVVANSAEVSQALTALIGRVDAIYLSNDNTVFSAISTVADICNREKIPLVTADPSSAESIPILAAVGFNYYQMGRATGRIVVDILKGKKTADIPTYFPTENEEMALVLNKKVAADLGLLIPEDLLAQASLVIE